MLTWAVGLMGAGLFSLPSFIGALCTDRRQVLWWVMYPWMCGIIVALFARILGGVHAYRLRVGGLAEATELRWLLIRQLDPDTLEREHGQVLKKYVKLSERSQPLDQLIQYLSYATYAVFLAGMALLAWRLGTC
jgi:hypothetical protein